MSRLGYIAIAVLAGASAACASGQAGAREALGPATPARAAAPGEAAAAAGEGSRSGGGAPPRAAPDEADVFDGAGELPSPDESDDGANAAAPDELDAARTAHPLPAPASRYAGLERASCEAELDRRKIAFDRVDSARGVVAPLRLAGPLSGVTFRSVLPEAKRKTAVIEIYDCRLVLALDDFAKILGRHGVVEVIHLSVYRPAPARVRSKGAGRRHAGALAIDAALFRTADGRTLNVQKDFHGAIGAKTCPPPPSASELRKIACEAADARLFNVVLTPDYNWPHRNHFHLEVSANARGFFVR